MKIAVIGAGAWGTGLALVLARRNHDVRLWAREPEVVRSIAEKRENQPFLPGHKLPEQIIASHDFDEVLNGAGIIVWVTPSEHCRATLRAMLPILEPGVPFISATKGIENNSLMRMTEVIADEFGKHGKSAELAAISGPSFAQEVARGDPTAISVASNNSELARLVQREFSGSTFRIYTSDDVTGVELGGALKNIIAIAAGICDGLGLGHNTIAALITRGLAEITRLAVVCGARRETLAGLSGMGDLVLTCTGGLSRNRTVGVELGRGRKLPEIVAGMHGMVAEGVLTTNAAVGLARQRAVEMPISEQMYAILHDGKSPRDAIQELMNRPGKGEA